MKETAKADLVRFLRRHGVTKVRESGSHEVWRVGRCQTAVPKHRRSRPAHAPHDSGSLGPVPRRGLAEAMMTNKCEKIYRATVEREPGWWIISIPELDLVTQARRVRDIRHMATDLVAAWLDKDLNDVRVEIEDFTPPAAVVAQMA